MSDDLELNRLAIHYVDKNQEIIEYAHREQNIQELDSSIIDFILNLVSDIWYEEDKGPYRSGNFVPDDDERMGPSVIKQYVRTIIQGEDGFFDTSKLISHHLYQQSPRTASPGLLAVVRLVRSEDGEVFSAILKIRHKDELFIRILSEALTQLEVEQVENMLLSDIEKGAVIPHPSKDDYDLKLIDRVTIDPARYFSEDFLGSLIKKSDEHQVKKLLPELKKFARERNLPVRTERLTRVITDLQERGTDVKTNVIAEVVQENNIFGSEFQSDDFVNYIEQESDLGVVDIPPERFVGRGKTGKKRRLVTYKFIDPRLRNVSISGPPELIDTILSIEGDSVTFLLETTKDGYDVIYE